MTTATRVAVNLLWAAPGRVGGSEQYLARQLVGLADGGFGSFDVAIHCTRPFVEAHPELASRFDTVVAPVSRDLRPLRVTLEHSWLAARVREADLVHHGGGRFRSVPEGRRC